MLGFLQRLDDIFRERFSVGFIALFAGCVEGFAMFEPLILLISVVSFFFGAIVTSTSGGVQSLLSGGTAQRTAFGEGGTAFFFLFVPFLVSFRGGWIDGEGSLRTRGRRFLARRGGLRFACIAGGLRLFPEYGDVILHVFGAGRLHSGCWLGPAGCFTRSEGGAHRNRKIRCGARAVALRSSFLG